MSVVIDSKEGLTRAMRSLSADLHDVLASFPDEMLILDRKQRVVAALGGQAFGPRAAAVHDQAHQRAFQGETVTYEWTLSKGRHDLRLSTAVSPLRNAASKIVGVLSVTRDITSTRDEKRLLDLERGLRQLTDVVEGRKRENANESQLSAREQDVLGLLRDGYRPRSIAQLLDVSPQTVRNHLKAIFKKTGTHSQEELITMSRR